MHNEAIQALLNNIEDRVFSFDNDLKLIAVNANMRSDFLTAFGVDLVKGVNVLENVPEPMYSIWLERYRRILNEESFEEIDEYEIKGVPGFVKLSFRPLYKNGEVYGGTCHSRDIGLQRNAEIQLHTNETHLYAQIDNTNESIWSVDRDIKILTINKVFKANFKMAFGHELQKGDCVLDYLDGELKEEWGRRYNKALSGQHFTETDRFEFGDFLQYVEVSFNPIRVDDQVVGVAGFTRDITENVLKQKELEIALEKALESDRFKSAFLANMSHEIRTPMNGLLGFTELLKEPGLTVDNQESYINIIEKSGHRLLSIINDLIDISKLEAGQMYVSTSDVDVDNQMEESYNFFKPEVEKKGLQVTCKNLGTQAKTIINTDKEKLYAILTNLIKNAIKYTDEGKIEFGFSAEDNYVKFFVKDTGIGIPKNKQSIVFERFVQDNRDNSEANEGAGLGLSITKAYIELLGGKIWVESEVGKGSVFYFTLPYVGKTKSDI